MIIDSHCHLNYEPMSKSLDDIINRANKEGVKYLLTIATEDKNYDKILNITNTISSQTKLTNCCFNL